jgi:Transketolase, thiamine diphosphate binding domain
MALVPLVYTIWNRVMRFDPQDSIWPNRDWFVLSNGVRLGFNLDQADGYFGSVRSPIAKSRHPFNLDQRAGPLASLNIKAPTWAGCPVSRL